MTGWSSYVRPTRCYMGGTNLGEPVQDKPIDYMTLCGVPSVSDIKKTLVPSSYPSLPLSGAAEPQQDPPQVTLVPPAYAQVGNPPSFQLHDMQETLSNLLNCELRGVE
jgi:hypothetical protein